MRDYPCSGRGGTNAFFQPYKLTHITQRKVFHPSQPQESSCQGPLCTSFITIIIAKHGSARGNHRAEDGLRMTSESL
jgi:hypothetical protein